MNARILSIAVTLFLAIGIGRKGSAVTNAAPTYSVTNTETILSFDTRGRIASLREQATGRELIAEPLPFVTVHRENGMTAAAERLTVEPGNRLIFSSDSFSGRITVTRKTQSDFYLFTVESVTVPDAVRLQLCSLMPACRKWTGYFANMISDETSGVCLRACDLPMTPVATGTRLRIETERARGLAGGRFGLVAGPRAGLVPALRALAETTGVPHSTLGGPWSLGTEANRGSYLFADLSLASVDDWIALAQRSGISTIHLHGWWKRLGHYGFNPGYFPNGLTDFRETVRRIHAAGLRAGMHTLTACIDPRDAWVTPVCSSNLLPWCSYTLAAALSPTDTVVAVSEKPSAKHDLIFTYAGNGNALRIGNEIIQYTGIRAAPPYAFTGCTRGAFGTRPAAHAVSSRTDYLQQRYFAFYPDPDSPLADELAETIGSVYRAGNLDQLYFDGSEGMMSRYGIDTMRRKIFTHLKPDALTEASCHGAHSWWFHARIGAWDHPRWAAKRFHDLHLRTTLPCRMSDLLEPQMGWWAPRRADATARGHFLDEMEYFASHNAGADAAMSIQGVNVTSRPLPVSIEEQMTVLGWYEHLRLARAFAPGVSERLAVPGAEFRLRQDAAGTWTITPISCLVHRVNGPADGSNRWTAPTGRVSAVRVEALRHADAAAPLRVLLDAAEDTALSTAGAAGITHTAARGKDAVHGPTLHLTATNMLNTRRGSWCRFSRTWPRPYRAFTGCEAFCLWVRGDGSGALLNLQIESPREYIAAKSDHYIRLDFTGWRRIEVLARERDVGEMDRFVWPYAGSYFLYRNALDFGHLSGVNVYLNDLPPGRATHVEISSVEIRPARTAQLLNPVLTIGGRAHSVPFTIDSDAFAEWEDGVWTLRRSDGEPIGRAVDPTPFENDHGSVLFTAASSDGTAPRAEVTLFTPCGASFPALRKDLSAPQQRALAYEAMPPILFHPSVGLSALPPLKIRPGESAAVSIELSGPIDRPVLEIGTTCLPFPVTLKTGERLFCTDGRTWRVLSSDRREIAKGTLPKPVPMFKGVLPLHLRCAAPVRDAVRLKLVKHY